MTKENRMQWEDDVLPDGQMLVEGTQVPIVDPPMRIVPRTKKQTPQAETLFPDDRPAKEIPRPARPLSGRLGTIADAHAKEREVETKIERAAAEAGPLTEEEIEIGARESNKYLDHLRGNADSSNR